MDRPQKPKVLQRTTQTQWLTRDSIKFSLSITEQRAVGFIPAWSLAFLQVQQTTIKDEMPIVLLRQEHLQVIEEGIQE